MKIRLIAVLFVAIATLFCGVSIAQASTMVTCQASPERGGAWSWRLIDGRKCWYRGMPGLAKTKLHWAKVPVVAKRAPAPRAMPIAAPVHEEADLLTSIWPAPPPPPQVDSFADRFNAVHFRTRWSMSAHEQR